MCLAALLNVSGVHCLLLQVLGTNMFRALILALCCGVYCVLATGTGFANRFAVEPQMVPVYGFLCHFVLSSASVRVGLFCSRAGATAALKHSRDGALY